MSWNLIVGMLLEVTVDETIEQTTSNGDSSGLSGTGFLAMKHSITKRRFRDMVIWRICGVLIMI